ncbi:MAG: hypothetical protein PHI97_34480 [Desulfobulbus sp.]|nr:hypothetical protein [Desulfobulbus sp.]
MRPASPVMLCRFSTAIRLDWPSVPLLLNGSLIWFCPSPEPGANCGMLLHDHADFEWDGTRVRDSF